MAGGFDALLRGQVMGDPGMAGMLAAYGGAPAFFYQKAPPDADRGWQGPCFPRVDYTIDMRHDAERKAAGALAANIWCSSESAAMPEDIERQLVGLVSGTLYSGPGMDTACAAWARSDSFDPARPEGGAGGPEVYGATALFDIMGFPEQGTTDPDPVQGLNAWSREEFPGAAVRNGTRMPPVWRPTDERPAIYWRFDGASTTDRQSYAVTWYNGQFAAHVIAGTVAGRNAWVKAVAERVQAWGEIPLPDGSPMFARQIQVRHGADPLREGQIMLTGQYGVLEQRRKERAGAYRLNNAVFPGMGAEVGSGKE